MPDDALDILKKYDAIYLGRSAIRMCRITSA
jgi:hypothetical protein